MKRNKKILIGSIASIASIVLLCSITIPLATKNNQKKHSQNNSPSEPDPILKESELPTLQKSQFSTNELGCQNLSIDQIQKKIDKNFFYENRATLFDNSNNINCNSVSNINVSKTTPYELTVKFVLNNREQEIKIIKTIQEEYGEIKPEFKQQQTPQIETFNNSSITVTNNNVPRTINNSYYDTDLLTKYKTLGFKYPSYDYNYETGENSILTLSDGTKLDMSNAVMDERVTLDGKQYKYSDPEFIRKEIEKNELKKHPAADGIHQQKLSDSQNAVEKSFSLQSSVKGMTSLGLYAPAGEVCELTFSEETYQQMSKQNIDNFKIVINQSYWDNYRKPDPGKISTRYPYVYTEFTVSLYDLTYDHKYQFATPFGGTISVEINTPLWSPSYSNIYKSYTNYDFTVSGAVEMLSYFHGLTTESDWNDQIAKVKNGTLSAPEMSIDFPFGSTNLAYTGIKQIAYTNIADIVYPKTQVSKWNDFLILSEYFASRDINNNIHKLNFRFNDDIWGGGAAWGGGDRLSCPLSWAKSSFLTESEWSLSNWGMLHEINHNFQQNDAFFIGDSHGETNQLTMDSFSIISDTGRWRNIANPTGEYNLNGWQRMSNLYSLIQWIKNGNYNANGNKTAGNGKPAQSAGEYEYQIYGLILFMIGSYNYANYAKHDIATDNGKDSNGYPAEGGFYEILELSDYFKLDFWPALQKYYPIWYDDGQRTEANSYPNWDENHKWPKDYNSATPAQKAQIDRLRTSYKSFDFIGNIYAAGIYMYDNDTGNYVYTNDSSAEYSIPAGKPYTFDFEKGINWLENDPNYKFSWSEIKFESKTKLGGTLELDPTNNKKLIYTPPANSIGEIDEFDMAIVPENFLGRPSNYVPLYKWKIKVRQVPNAAVASTYIFPNDSYLDYYNLDKRINYMRDDANIINNDITDLSQGGINFENNVDKDVPGGTRVKLNFIAPETGTYRFKVKYSFQIKMYKGFDKNAEEIYSNCWYSPGSYQDINKEFRLTKGEVLPLDIFILSGSSTKSGNYIYKEQKPCLDIQATLNGNDIIDFASNIINPDAVNLIDDPSKFITDKKYHYSSHRNIDLNKLQTSLFGLNVSRDVNTIDTSKYTFQAVAAHCESGPITFNNIDSPLKKVDHNYVEIWAPKNSNHPDTDLVLEFNANFNTPTNIGSVNFYNRTDNWTQARPTNITIKDQDDNVLYDGKFGEQFADRSSASTIINFDKVHQVTQLKFTVSNDTVINNGGNRTALIIDAITFTDQVALPVNKVISIQNPEIMPYGDWIFINNDSKVNISNVNGKSIKSSKNGDFIVFDIFAEAFDIVGQKALNNSNFDIYINDEFVANVDTNNASIIENTILYSYTSKIKGGEQMRVKIVNKSDKPLYLDYIQTYGKEVYLSKK